MTERTRNFASIVYPESAPENWREILSNYCIKFLISPLHDKDINPTGETKKAHYHVILMFNGPKTIKQAQDIFSSFGAIQCKVVNELIGYARYLIHLDNPEKAQYNADDVISGNGCDWRSIITTTTDKYQAKADICDYCLNNNIVSYSDLIDDLRKSNFEWFKVASDNTVFFKNYLQSKVWTSERSS